MIPKCSHINANTHTHTHTYIATLILARPLVVKHISVGDQTIRLLAIDVQAEDTRDNHQASPHELVRSVPTKLRNGLCASIQGEKQQS